MGTREAEAYAVKNRMSFFEVSPLCDFNIRESFSELSRMALHRNGMERLWRSNKGKFFKFSVKPILILVLPCYGLMSVKVLSYVLYIFLFSSS